ncbi:unnamed protein product [Caenorhabditis angaria]|uniref:Uncharacterized protein n=1 Tax=Caenorhabditis angaria TaxID=860376 RepID=A0A9P1MZV1_9PELO|nr:unnamed protein product [Caenorhabditis angaria]
MCHWFQNLNKNRKSKLENLNGFSEEVSAIFNLMRIGSLEVLDFRGLKSLHWTTFVKSIQKYKKIGRGTQGSSSANPNVEYMAASPNSPRPLPGPAAEGPRQQRPNFQKQKKKKSSKF